MRSMSRLLRSPLVASRALRSAAKSSRPPFCGVGLRSFASPVIPNPTPSPNPWAAKKGGETDTRTAHPTNVQAHSSSAETSRGAVASDTASSPTDERLVDAEPLQANWVDYRPNLVEVKVRRNAEGDMVGQWGGEEVIFPDLDTSLDWVLSTPVDVHLFEEVPIIKECPDEH